MEELDKEKKLKLIWLLGQVLFDPIICRFMDITSDKMFAEKIEVLEARAAGKAPCEIPNYYKVLEKYPDNHPEDYPRRSNGKPMWD